MMKGEGSTVKGYKNDERVNGERKARRVKWAKGHGLNERRQNG